MIPDRDFPDKSQKISKFFERSFATQCRNQERGSDHLRQPVIHPGHQSLSYSELNERRLKDFALFLMP